MNKYKKIILLVIFIVQIFFEISARNFNIKDVTESEKVEYRPDKYIKNGLLDVMFGNKTLINIISRDLTTLLKKATMSKYFALFYSLQIKTIIYYSTLAVPDMRCTASENV